MLRRAAWVLAASLAVPHAHASSSVFKHSGDGAKGERPRAACSDAYKPEYKTDWDVSEYLWHSLCSKGRVPTEILREAQKKSIRKCMKAYRAPAAAAGINEANLRSYCAQGAEGRARAAALSGAVPKPDPVQANLVKPPGSAGMGPAAEAFQLAHAKWMPDACWSGMDYTWRPAFIIPKEEYDKQRRAPGYKPREVDSYRDEYIYYFASPAKTIELYQVRIWDEEKDIFQTEIIRSKGPEEKTKAMTKELALCLAGVNLEPQAALDGAAKAGLYFGARSPVAVQLRRFPPGYFQSSACTVRLNLRDVHACVDTWTERRKTRTLEDRTVWAVMAEDRTAFLDAATGRFLYLGNGTLDSARVWTFIRKDPRSQPKEDAVSP